MDLRNERPQVSSQGGTTYAMKPSVLSILQNWRNARGSTKL